MIYLQPWQQLINTKCELRNRMKENLHSMRDAGGDGHEIDRFRCSSREANVWNILV